MDHLRVALIVVVTILAVLALVIVPLMLGPYVVLAVFGLCVLIYLAAAVHVVQFERRQRRSGR